ncbi:hypothetical protein HanPI659440_Chr07g0278021 [Helianthus annuus]|nr:hypothetical protein HanPI659440_Chr07g0278021 [Helianthus annuus]
MAGRLCKEMKKVGKGLSGNEIAKVGDYSCNFKKLGTKGENGANHRHYPSIFLFFPTILCATITVYDMFPW